jgi:methylase of polypeptide subunit release factors
MTPPTRVRHCLPHTDLRWLPPRLRAAGYTAQALKGTLNVHFPDDVGVLNHAPALARVGGDQSPAATLIRLFFLEADVPARPVAAAFSRRDVAVLVDAGVLQRRAAAVRARVRIDPIGDQYIVADRRFRAVDRHALGLPGRDPVYPPSSDSLILRDAIVAPAARRVLDLCTGSGVQALPYAHTAERVLAVDINPRAVAMAQHNARMNGADQTEVRLGDVYAPVAGEQFDLIIANPPFVASPYTKGPAYHSGGPTGDRVLRRIIAGLGPHLQPGGRAFAVAHVALRVGEPLEAVATGWFADFAGRAVVLVLETGTPVDLAAAQSLFALERGTSAYAAELQRWVRYLRRHRIGTVALLLIVAEQGERRTVEVVEAQPRVLPLPLSPPPAERIKRWCSGSVPVLE